MERTEAIEQGGRMVNPRNGEPMDCELCAQQSESRPAVGRTMNAEYSGYVLCAECIAHYDAEAR